MGPSSRIGRGFAQGIANGYIQPPRKDLCGPEQADRPTETKVKRPRDSFYC
jgi:hypothetical protein